MDFRISGLPAYPFQHLYGLSNNELSEQNVIRYIVDEYPGFPDRIQMRDAQIGETVLLLNYQHQPAPTPYQASHAIFITEGANQSFDRINLIPQCMQIRPQSLRAFDATGMMLEADLALSESEQNDIIQRMFEDSAVAYIHAHNAKQGCYSGKIERA